MLSFQELYESYAPEVYRFAFWLAGNSFEAEDITSEAFIKEDQMEAYKVAKRYMFWRTIILAVVISFTLMGLIAFGTLAFILLSASSAATIQYNGLQMLKPLAAALITRLI